MRTPRSVPVWLPPVADLLVVTGFVLVGRRSHDEAESLAAFARTWWPFAAAIGLGGVVSGAWWRPFAWGRVAAMLVVTVAVGMTLRITVHDRDLEPSFVVVTTLFLTLCCVGWRLAARALARRGARAGRVGERA